MVSIHIIVNPMSSTSCDLNNKYCSENCFMHEQGQLKDNLLEKWTSVMDLIE